MRRREFIAALGGAATAWPLRARAQQSERIQRIGVLDLGAEHDPQTASRLRAFKEGLQDLGWTESRNFWIEYRSTAGGADRARASAAELVRLKSDVISVRGATALSGLLTETSSVPIVFVLSGDPVDTGFVSNLARPGGNVTGFTELAPTIGQKWLELLKEIAPGTTRVLVLSSQTSAIRLQEPVIEAALASFGVHASVAYVQNAADIEQAFAGHAGDSQTGVIVLPTTPTFIHRKLIYELAARHRLPAIYAYRNHTLDGGLMSYGPETTDVYRKVASYVDRILRGEKPGDLPVQIATKFHLVLNLKTARTLGLTVPLTLQAQADEVIE